MFWSLVHISIDRLVGQEQNCFEEGVGRTLMKGSIGSPVYLAALQGQPQV